MAVDIPITGSSDELVTALEAAIRAFAASTEESNKLKKAEQELAEQEKKLADEAKKKADALDKAKSGLTKAVEATLKYGAAVGGAIDGVKGLYEGVTGAVSAVIDFVKEIGEASKELEGFVSREYIKQLEQMNTSFDDIDKSVLLLKASLVEELVPGIERFTNIVIGAINKTREWSGELDDLAKPSTLEWLAGWGESIASALTAGGSDNIKKVLDYFEDSGELASKQLALMNDINKGWADAPKFVQDLLKEEEKIAKEVKKFVEERQKAEQDLEDWRNQAISDRISADAADWQKRQDAAAKYYEWLRDARAEDFKEEAEQASEAIAAMAEQQEEATDLWIEQQEARAEAQKEAAWAAVDAWTSAISDIADAQLEENAAELDRIHNRQAELRAQLADATGAEKERIAEKLAGLAEEEKVEKEAARSAFQTSQAAAIAGVISSGAAAFAAMLLTFAALGPGAPLAAGAVVAPSVAAQLSAIGKNKPPAHSGAALGADELPFGNRTVRNGEGAVIFNQRAVEQGAMERAMADNRAAMGGGTSSEVRLVLADSGRAISEVATRDARRPGSAFGTPVRGFSDPYRRR